MSDNYKSRSFFYKIWGDYALFTDPLTKGVGEKFTYSVPSYQAIKGITENLYWKPTIVIVIDEIKVMKQILTQTSGIRLLLGSGSRNKADRSYYTYLKDVEYLVKFHFEWNLNRPDLAPDRQARKHEEVLQRTLKKGGRRDVFLGTRECLAFVEPITEADYQAAESYYFGQTINFGMMFHSFNYPSESDSPDYEHLEANFTNTLMKDGVIEFVRPEQTMATNVLSKFDYRDIPTDTVFPVEKELDAMERR